MDLAQLLTKAGPHCLTLYFSKWCHCYKQLLRFLFEAELYQILISSYSYFWENRCVDDTTINKIFSSLLCKTSRFHVALGLFNRRLQNASKCGNIISGTLGCPSFATFLFLSILMLSVIFQSQCKFCWGVHEQTSIKNKN